MLGLGLAVSHAPSMFRSLEHWPLIHRVLTDGVPQPREIEKETPAVLQSYIDRINLGFEALKKQLEAFKPDVLLVVGDDQGEVFTEANMPTYALFTCAEVHGSINIGLIGEPEEENHVTLRCAADLALHLLGALKREGFDVSESKELKPLGRPKRGLGHAFTRPVVKVTPQLNVPVIPLHVNCYFAPMPPARQCYELGLTIAQALKARPERVAIMASGGLSHDPRGPRAGWIAGSSNSCAPETPKDCVICSSSIPTHCAAAPARSEVGLSSPVHAAGRAPPLSIISRRITL